MMSGVSVVPKIQWTLTSSVLRTANSVIRIARAIATTVRACSRRLRLSGLGFEAPEGLCADVDIADTDATRWGARGQLKATRPRPARADRTHRAPRPAPRD